MDRTFHIAAPPDPRPRLDVGPPFHRLNGRWMALDFVNTVHAWVSTRDRPGGHDWRDRITRERLRTAGDLVQWAELEGILDEAGAARLREAADRMPPGEAASILERARGLRNALYRLLVAAIEGWEPRPEDLATLNAGRERLGPGETVAVDGGYRLEWRSDAPRLEGLLWPVLLSATRLLGSTEDLARVGQCGGDPCGWLFYDTPRGRPRRWCDTRDCGNVARVRAFRRRRRHRHEDGEPEG